MNFEKKSINEMNFEKKSINEMNFEKKSINEMTSLVIPTLTGGLGQRLFQLATAIAYGEQYNRKVVLHHSLVCENPYEDKDKIYEMVPQLEREVYIHTLQNATTLRENFPLRSSKSQVVVLEGDFKDQRFFEYAKLEHFPIFPACLHPREDLEHTVFLHFKRNFPLTSYYKTALKRIPEDKKIFVVCEDNDMPWLKKNILELFPFVSKDRWMFQPQGLCPVEVLWIMTRCQGGAICANSSLSWWGSYLGARVAQNPCYFPAKWFSKGQTTTTILPKWGKILIV
jgi:hypothetical protein